MTTRLALLASASIILILAGPLFFFALAAEQQALAPTLFDLSALARPAAEPACILTPAGADRWSD